MQKSNLTFPCLCVSFNIRPFSWSANFMSISNLTIKLCCHRNGAWRAPCTCSVYLLQKALVRLETINKFQPVKHNYAVWFTNTKRLWLEFVPVHFLIFLCWTPFSTNCQHNTPFNKVKCLSKSSYNSLLKQSLDSKISSVWMLFSFHGWIAASIGGCSNKISSVIYFSCFIQTQRDFFPPNQTLTINAFGCIVFQSENLRICQI